MCSQLLSLISSIYLHVRVTSETFALSDHIQNKPEIDECLSLRDLVPSIWFYLMSASFQDDWICSKNNLESK